MRRAAWIAGSTALLLLAGCHREPTFDERYASAEREIRGKAGSIDAELAARASEAAAADTLASGAPDVRAPDSGPSAGRDVVTTAPRQAK